MQGDSSKKLTKEKELGVVSVHIATYVGERNAVGIFMFLEQVLCVTVKDRIAFGLLISFFVSVQP